jgi:rubredoxin
MGGATVRLERMEETRECPMCGGAMRLKRGTRAQHVAGYGASQPKETKEWVCPECDYFEEVDEDE